MKILGISLGKEKPVTFNEFRDIVRLAVRREQPGARLEPRDDGFILYREGESPVVCNIKQLYGNYYKSPGSRDALIAGWIGSLTFETPRHTWTEACYTLRPTLKNKGFIDAANKSLAKQEDSLPSQPFAGELHTIIMRDLPGTAVAVTQSMLTEWGMTLEQCLAEAMGNMGTSKFPEVSNALMSGSGKKGMPQEEVGLVFKGDHLTATWLVSERFRDYVGQRLQGDYVVSVPNRAQLTAIRADEPGLIASVLGAARNFTSQPYPLSAQMYHVNAALTGGAVEVYQPGVTGIGAGIPLSAGQPLPTNPPSGALPNIGSLASDAPLPPSQPKALNDWYGLSESTTEEEPAPPSNVKINKRR